MALDGPIPGPTLPEDLEQEIFGIAAHLRPGSIPTLILVAWRVKIWVEPLLYRTIVLSPPTHPPIDRHPVFHRDLLMNLINSKPASFLRGAVRHLLLYRVHTDDVEAIVSACPAVENLWVLVNGIHNLLPLIQNLPLKRLHVHSTQLFASLSKNDFTHRVFAHITHLEIFDSYIITGIDLEVWSGISLIPNLSHLSFNDEEFLTLCTMLLRTCNSLRVLVLLDVDPPDVLEQPELVKDHRFVCMGCSQHVKDWQMGAHMGVDYWSRAEEFVAKRRSGEIDLLRYMISEDESFNIP
ncbi:hypothetical protein B0H17DRAFT_1027434 [Mycena rosella]|uniref:F-box domain-containing protein n=1 Tax=Mycena rosella TaxID=1033263 RepID=A0AAD7MCZ6_MYCRO|nr:hypothetical protein B0H17DRAFT_1027434 [Mycena rosella]